MTIKDELIKPYFISKESGNYDVLEDTGKEDKKGNKITRLHGHFSTTEGALLKIAKLLVETDRVLTIKEYVEELKELKAKFKI